MRVDMTPVLSGSSDFVSFSFDWEGAEERFPLFIFEKPVHITGNITNRAGYMLLTLNADVSYKTECARCLKELHRDLSLHLEKNVAVGDTITEDAANDYVIVENSAVYLDEPAEELLYLELPTRELCIENCRGLCPKCGKELNSGECGCDLKEIDPRLAVLKNFLGLE